MRGKVLVVEDEFLIIQDLYQILLELNYAVCGTAKSAEETIDKIDQELPDLILLDINLKGAISGIELAKSIDKKYKIPYIYITSYSDSSTIKEMNTTNPLSYILKPFDNRDIRVALEMGFSKIRLPKDMDHPKISPKKTNEQNKIIGRSKLIQETFKKIGQVAQTDVTVLIQGETGTGKELVMETIHNLSKRKSKELIKVNCAALPSELIESLLFGHEKGSFTGATNKRIGKFEKANGGTIFLDEIGELPLDSQSKLLRCLQEKEIEPVGSNIYKKVDVRVVTATNRDLKKDVYEGRFRSDLYYRLNIFPIEVPALKDRKEDIDDLVDFFLNKFCEEIGRKQKPQISKSTRKSIYNYRWPGNIRELRHFVERGVLLAENNVINLTVDNEPPNSFPIFQNNFEIKSMEDVERQQIIQTLKYCNGKIRGVNGAAHILKLNPSTLDFKIKKLGIVKDQLFVN